MPALTPIRRADWARRKARHLLNRAGFGVPASALDYLTDAGPEDAVASFVDYERFRDVMVEPDFLPTREDYIRHREEQRAEQDPDRRRMLGQQFRRMQREAMQRLQAWWLNLLQFTSRPLQEKMALFWHGHFATSAEKVQVPGFNWQLNQAFRRHATGDFHALVTAVGKSPAMLHYLDNNQNRKGHPNENWARELMELFTLGIGNYTERDIQEAARAFSGWTFADEGFFYNVAEHDFGMKTFLGQRGLFDGEDIIGIIFEQPAMPRFIARKLWLFFAHEEPADSVVEALAQVFTEGGFQLKPLLRAMFTSREFYTDAVVHSQIKSPVQYLIGLLETLGVSPGRADQRQMRQLNVLLRGMGQHLFYPPNVKGWDGNRAWINTNLLLIRYNIAGAMVNGQVPDNLRERLELDETEEDLERLQQMEERLRRRIHAPFNAAAFFTPLDGKPLGEMLDTAIDRFVGHPVEPGQRALLLAAIDPDADETTPLRLRQVNEIYLRGFIHLLLSLAEYQLC